MSHPMKKKLLPRYWQSEGRGTEQVAGSIPDGGGAHTMAPSWQCPPEAVCQCALYTFQTGCTSLPAPAWSSFGFCLPQYILGQNSAGEVSQQEAF